MTLRQSASTCKRFVRVICFAPNPGRKICGLGLQARGSRIGSPPVGHGPDECAAHDHGVGQRANLRDVFAGRDAEADGERQVRDGAHRCDQAEPPIRTRSTARP